MASRKIFGLFLCCELFSVGCRFRLQIYELFKVPMKYKIIAAYSKGFSKLVKKMAFF